MKMLLQGLVGGLASAAILMLALAPVHATQRRAHRRHR
jgi:hypothetical protein